MSKWLGIVCVVACFGIGCGDDDGMTGTDTGPVGMTDGGPGPADAGPGDTDAGPGDTDAGPVVVDDAGPVVVDDAGPAPMCDFDNTYTVAPVEGNPPLCAAVTITECTVATVAGVTTATCGDVSGECTYDAACVCTGETEAMGIAIVIRADFPNLTLEADAAGSTCQFTLAM